MNHGLYAMRHLYLPYTHEPSARYSTRKHCRVHITTLSHDYIIEKFTEIFGKVRKSPGFPKTSETIQNRFWVYTILEDFKEIFRIFENFLNIFSKSKRF